MKKLLCLAIVLISIPAFADLQGKLNPGVLNEEANRAMAADKKAVYESKEFVIGVATVDYNFKTSQGAFGSTTLPIAHNFVIRTNATITLRFNSITNDPITITAAEGQFSWNHVEITNIFITTTGAATIKILLT